MTHVVNAAERRLARLRLRSTWTALKVARLTGNNIKLTRERDVAIQNSIEIKAKILLHAQQRSQERAHQVCGSVCAVVPVTPVLQHAENSSCHDKSSTRCILRQESPVLAKNTSDRWTPHLRKHVLKYLFVVLYCIVREIHRPWS